MISDSGSAGKEGIGAALGRRSTRLNLQIPLILRGADASGRAFKENVWTLDLNKHGARIATFHELTAGSEITVENPVLGYSARARIAKIYEKQFPENPAAVGVELLEAKNVWGIRFPPEDWKEGAIPRGREIPPAGARAAPAPRPAARTETPGAGAEAPEGKQLEERLAAVAAAPEAAAPGEATTKPSSPVDSSDEKSAEAMEKARGDLEEKVRAAERLEERLASLIEHLKAAQSGAQETLSRAHEARLRLSSAAEEVSKKISEETGQAVAAALERFRAQLEEQAKNAEVGPKENLAAFREQLSDISKSSQEGMRQYLEVQAKGIREEIEHTLQRIREEAVGGFGEELRRAAETQIQTATEALAQRAGEAAEKHQADLKMACGQILTETERQLSQARRESTETLGREAQAVAEQYRDELRRLGDDLRERTTKEFEAALEGAAAAQRATLVEDLRRALAEVQERNFSQLEERAKELTQEATDHLHRLVGTGTLAVEQSVELARQRMAEAAEKAVEGIRGQFGELFQASAAQARRDAEVVLHDLRERLAAAARSLAAPSGAPRRLAERESPTAPPEPARDASETALASLADDLSRRHELAVQEAVESFRARIAEVLAPYGSGARRES
jgi:hypothetical protein